MSLTYSLDEAAAQLGVKPKWLGDQLRAGVFTGHKLANRWRLTDADIAAILAQTEKPACPRPPAAAATHRPGGGKPQAAAAAAAGISPITRRRKGWQ